MNQKFLACLSLAVLLSALPFNSSAGGKGDVMLRILKQEPGDRAMQKRIKGWEKEAGFLAALKEYESKEKEYQKTMQEWEKARKSKPPQTEQLSELGRKAGQLWDEKLKAFFAALQAKKNAYALEHKHQMTEIARREGREVPIPKPQD